MLLLFCGCGAHVSNKGAGALAELGVGAAVLGVAVLAQGGAPLGSPQHAERDLPIELLMRRTEGVVRLDPNDAACSARAARTGDTTWQVDSCREHLDCATSPGTAYSCVARKLP